MSESALTPDERRELAKGLAAKRKWRELWNSPGMDRVCAILNREPTWDEIKSAEETIKDIEELGYDFKRKESTNPPSANEHGLRKYT